MIMYCSYYIQHHLSSACQATEFNWSHCVVDKTNRDGTVEVVVNLATKYPAHGAEVAEAPVAGHGG